ncbi:hypothetical protein BGW37DRAFT_465878 [Umbelopsis sp. PMI_123]|nr:hypothetical protein BGW37DRAFT_465878 [Umbelopsis sp. PMI_123]
MTTLRRRERWEDLVFIRLNLQGRNVQLVDHEKQHDGLTSVTSPTEHLVNETSEINETSETDNLMAGEIKSKRKGKDQYYKLGRKGRVNIGGPGYKKSSVSSMKASQSRRKRAVRSDVQHERDSEHDYEDSDEFPLLVHILRGPSKLAQVQKGGSRDTNIWAAEIEPAIDNASSNIVTLCGADTVELIDVAQGQVVKKFSHMEQKEEFFCLAWTSLTSSDSWSQGKSYNILAAAGKLGTIKPFNPTQTLDRPRTRWTVACVPTALCISNDMRWLLAGCDNGQMYRYNLGSAAINRFRRGKMAAMAKFKPGHKRCGYGIIQYKEPDAV